MRRAARRALLLRAARGPAPVRDVPAASGRTGWPGWILFRPSATICSPAWTPSLISTKPFCRTPVTTGRCSAMLCSPCWLTT